MAKLLSGTRIYGNLLIDTNVAILGSNISSSTTTGALTVAGGAGIAGNVFVGNVLASGFFYANGTPFVSSSYGNATVASYLPTYTGSLAASADIVTLTANAGAQANQIAGANAAIVTANTALKAYTDAQITTTQSWVTGANAAIVTANTALKSYVDTQDSAITTAWTANAGAQANQIAGANAAIITANSAVVSYVNTLNTAMASNVAGANASVITANTALKGYVDAQITNLTNGAPAILDTLGEIATSLGNNASLSTTLLNAIAGSNAAIVTANTALKAYTDAQITTTQSWVTGANAAIVTANTALKSYVDTQDSAITTAWTSNAGAQANQITGANTVVATLQANVGSFYTYANTKIGTNTNSNLVVVATTTSTSTTTGALVVAGGVGVAGNVYVAGSLVTSGSSGNISGVSTLIATTVNAATIGNTNAVHTGSTGTFTSWANVTGTATSTSTTTGALVVAGGAGIAGNLNIGGVAKYSGGNIFLAPFAGNGGLTINQFGIWNEQDANNQLYQVWTSGAGTTPGAGGGLWTAGAGMQVYSSAELTFTMGRTLRSQNYPTGGTASTGQSITFSSAGQVTISNNQPSTSTSTGALIISGGGLGVAGNVTTANVYATGVYIGSGSAISGLFWSANNAAVSGGVTYTSTGAGNITVSGSTLALTTTGPGAVTTGNSTAIPVITTDAYGRISSISTSTVSTTISLAGTSGTGSVAGGGTLTFAGSNGMTATASGSTITISTPQDLQTTALPTFANVTVANIIINTGGKRNGRNIVTNYSGNTAPVTPLAGDEWFRGNTGVLYKYVFDNVTSTNNWIDISSALYNANTAAVANTIALRDSGGNLTATNFLGIASSAKYADLAEMYTADDDYGPATVVVFGGAAEITVTTESHDSRVAGVISTNPAYLMNSELPNGLPVAFTGRVPCLVQGPVDKGDLLVTSTTPGVAQRLDNSLFKPGCVVGKSLGSIQNDEVATIEVAVGRY